MKAHRVKWLAKEVVITIAFAIFVIAVFVTI